MNAGAWGLRPESSRTKGHRVRVGAWEHWWWVEGLGVRGACGLELSVQIRERQEPGEARSGDVPEELGVWRDFSRDMLRLGWGAWRAEAEAPRCGRRSTGGPVTGAWAVMWPFEAVGDNRVWLLQE